MPTLKDKYTNEILFKERKSKYNRILYRNRSNLINENEDNINNMNNFQNSKILSRNNNNYLRDKINIFNMKKYSIVNRFLAPNKRPFIIKDLDSDSRDNRFNKQINYNLKSYNNNISNKILILSRIKSALFITDLNSYHSFNK